MEEAGPELVASTEEEVLQEKEEETATDTGMDLEEDHAGGEEQEEHEEDEVSQLSEAEVEEEVECREKEKEVEKGEGETEEVETRSLETTALVEEEPLVPGSATGSREATDEASSSSKNENEDIKNENDGNEEEEGNEDEGEPHATADAVVAASTPDDGTAPAVVHESEVEHTETTEGHADDAGDHHGDDDSVVKVDAEHQPTEAELAAEKAEEHAVHDAIPEVHQGGDVHDHSVPSIVTSEVEKESTPPNAHEAQAEQHAPSEQPSLSAPTPVASIPGLSPEKHQSGGASPNGGLPRGGTGGLLSFAYSPRNFGTSSMVVSAAGSVAAAAAGSVISPRLKIPGPNALSTSVPHSRQPTIPSPRVLLSPPPPLNIPKPAKPLGSSIEPGQEPKVIIVQKLWRRKLAQRKLSQMIKHSQARYKVAEELMVTEKNYVDILHTIIEVFMEPLSKQLPGWLAEQSKAKKAKGAVDPLVSNLVEIIFGNTKELYKMHKAFYESLQYAIKNWYPYCKVGTLFTDVLLRMNGFLVEYGKYVNGYGQAIKHWNQAMKNPSFARFINTALDNPRCNHLDFCSLIINPVQRVPRYALLLRDIQKHTWAGHGDEENIAHALDKIHIVAEYVNEAKRAAEGMERTTFLQEHLDDKKVAASLAQPQRKYIREGPLRSVQRSELQDRHVILFNDLIVITENKANKGKTPPPRLPVGALPTDLRVKSTIALTHGIELKTLDKPERAFQITIHGKSTKWQAPSVKERDEWLADLQSLASRPLSHSS